MARDSHRRDLWQQAGRLAGQTPESRDRTVDLLRALSILVVVFGHWLMFAPWMDADGPHYGHMLEHAPWTRWLTWGLQVMPVFFMVGGYANGTSWEAARRDGRGYREWLAARLRRLLVPVIPLLMFWGVAVRIAAAAGVPDAMIRVGTISALVPTWFLSIYVVVVMLAPLAVAAWRRYGMASFWVPTGCAVVVDVADLRLGLGTAAFVNYLFVWGAVHQLGCAWRAGVTRRAAAGWLLGGLAALILMTSFGPWPHSLVGVPGAELSNNTPPRLPLLALAAMQFGLVVLLRPMLSRWMARPRAWTGAVLVNGLIMTVFLWHSTAMLAVAGLAMLGGGTGLGAQPESFLWWVLRVPWLTAYLLVLLPLVALFARFERLPHGTPPAPWRMVAGSLLASAGIGVLAYEGLTGVGSSEALLLVGTLAGLLLAVLPFASKSRPVADDARLRG